MSERPMTDYEALQKVIAEIPRGEVIPGGNLPVEEGKDNSFDAAVQMMHRPPRKVEERHGHDKEQSNKHEDGSIAA